MLNKQQRLRIKKEKEKLKKSIEHDAKTGKLAESRRLYLEQKARYEASTHDQIEYSKRAMALAKKKRDFYLAQAEKSFEEMERKASGGRSSSRGRGIHNSSLDGESDLSKALILISNLLSK